MRVTRVAHSRKEWKCSKCGVIIKKGDPYIWTQAYMGPVNVHCTQHPFRQSELVSSDKLQQLYGAQETLQDALNEVEYDVDTVEEVLENLKGSIQDAIDGATDVSEQYQDSISNMEEYFSESQTMDDMNEKSEACEDWVSELEDAQSDIDSAISEISDIRNQPSDDIDKEEDPVGWEEDIRSQIDEKVTEIQSTVQEAIDSLSI